MSKGVLALFVCAVIAAACGSPDIRPVDIFAEDMCAGCRMAFSDKRFAAELVTLDNEIFKFDDIGCWETFRKEHGEKVPAAEFVRDFASNTWIPARRAVIVRTGVATPMASGKVAFADSAKAGAFVAEHPILATDEARAGAGCCGKEG
jgi:copper chaperone NosL